MKLNIAVCDDENNFADLVFDRAKKILDEGMYDYEIQKFSSAEKLLRYCAENSIDIVLSDIDMPDMNGFEMKEKLYDICRGAYVIFITAHEELAYQSYTYRPYWFVSKKDIQRLDGELTKLADKIIAAKSKPEIVHIMLNEPIGIDVGEVMYLESHRNYILFHKCNGEIVRARGKINDVNSQLKEKGFIGVQKSYVVNCRFISKFTRAAITMTDGTQINVTRNVNKLTKAQNEYMRFLRNTRW